jgi:hypothetical protein
MTAQQTRSCSQSSRHTAQLLHTAASMSGVSQTVPGPLPHRAARQVTTCLPCFAGIFLQAPTHAAARVGRPSSLEVVDVRVSYHSHGRVSWTDMRDGTHKAGASDEEPRAATHVHTYTHVDRSMPKAICPYKAELRGRQDVRLSCGAPVLRHHLEYYLSKRPPSALVALRSPQPPSLRQHCDSSSRQPSLTSPIAGQPHHPSLLP